MSVLLRYQSPSVPTHTHACPRARSCPVSMSTLKDIFVFLGFCLKDIFVFYDFSLIDDFLVFFRVLDHFFRFFDDCFITLRRCDITFSVFAL